MCAGAMKTIQMNIMSLFFIHQVNLMIKLCKTASDFQERKKNRA